MTNPSERTSPYIVERRTIDGWGVFKVSIERGQIAAAMLKSYDDRQAASRNARDEAAWLRFPITGSHGLEVVPVSEVRF